MGSRSTGEPMEMRLGKGIRCALLKSPQQLGRELLKPRLALPLSNQTQFVLVGPDLRLRGKTADQSSFLGRDLSSGSAGQGSTGLRGRFEMPGNVGHDLLGVIGRRERGSGGSNRPR